jgi:hypothetical protein
MKHWSISVSKKKKKETITLRITPPLGRDFIHLSEITHGSGCGAHGGEKPRANGVDISEHDCPICGVLDCYDCDA